MNLIIDSNYICHKVRYGMVNVDLSHDDVFTDIIFGFLNTFLMLCKRFMPDEYTFCWDSKKSYRWKEYPEYKANRKKVEKTAEEKEFDNISYAQFNVLRRYALPEMGFQNVFIQTGIESDDIMAAVVKRYPDKESLIITSDKDMFQLITNNVSMYNPHTKKIMDLKSFRDMYNIEPYDWVLAKAIGGCDTDNVAGIKGVGDPAKSLKSLALKYVRGDMKKGAVLKRIESEEGQQIIKRNKKLIELPHRKTGTFTLKKATLFTKQFVKVFDDYGFASFTKPSELRIWQNTLGLY